MNKKKTLIILALVCLVIYSSYFTIIFITNGNEQNDENQLADIFLKDNEHNFTYSVLKSIKPSDIKAFTCRSNGKELIYIKDDNGWVCNDSSAVLDNLSVSYALNTLADIKIYEGESIQILDESEENIKKCGLNDGFEIILTFTNDTTVTYKVGNYLKFGSAYYFTCGDGKIYTVLNRFTSALSALF